MGSGSTALGRVPAPTPGVGQARGAISGGDVAGDGVAEQHADDGRTVGDPVRAGSRESQQSAPNERLSTSGHQVGK
jgi:hypothetical protein